MSQMYGHAGHKPRSSKVTTFEQNIQKYSRLLSDCDTV